MRTGSRSTSSQPPRLSFELPPRSRQRGRPHVESIVSLNTTSDDDGTRTLRDGLPMQLSTILVLLLVIVVTDLQQAEGGPSIAQAGQT